MGKAKKNSVTEGSVTKTAHMEKFSKFVWFLNMNRRRSVNPGSLARIAGFIGKNL